MLSKSAEVSDSTSALDLPIACVMWDGQPRPTYVVGIAWSEVASVLRALTIPVLISDVDTRRGRLSTLY